MNRFFFLFLLFSQISPISKMQLVNGVKPFHSGIKFFDSEGRVNPKYYINPDFDRSVDKLGEFSFWSNAFLTINQGEEIKFPGEVQITYMSGIDTVGNTYLISSTMYPEKTIAQILSIYAVDDVYVCFRTYTKDSIFFGEVTLRRPDRGDIADEILEAKNQFHTQNFFKNKFNAMESIWTFENDSKFEVLYNNVKAELTPKYMIANLSCFRKQAPGNLYLTYVKDKLIIRNTDNILI